MILDRDRFVSMAQKIAMGHGQLCCNGSHNAILLDCPIEILHVSAYSDTSFIFIC